MDIVWGMMNSMQLVRIATKFNIEISHNVYLYFYHMDAFLNMKLQIVNDFMEDLELKLFNNGDIEAIRKMTTYIVGGIVIGIIIICSVILNKLK